MRLTEFLSESAIKVPLSGDTKEAAIRELIAVIGADWLSPESHDEVFSSVLEREEVMSTGIGHGIALPHGSGPREMGLRAALGIASHPIDFDAIDGQPVDLIFLLLSGAEHAALKLKALARISRLLHCEAFREALASARSPRQAMEIITREEQRHAI